MQNFKVKDCDIFYLSYPNIKKITITGTNGKSTTSKLLYDVLKEHKKDEGVKGIIVAGKFDEKLKYAKTMLQNSEAFLYEVDFKIKEYKWKKF